MKTKRFVIWFLLLALVAISAACQNASPAANEDKPAAPQVEGVQNTQSPPAQAATASVQHSSGGSGDFNIDDFSVGLDRLSSYRQSLVLAFDGTVSGAETHSKTSVRRTVMRDPAAALTWIELDEALLQMYGTVGEVVYHQAGPDGACFADLPAIETAAPALAFQLQALPAVVGASAVGEETVNGVLSMHYTFNESAIGHSGDLKATGELWVAKDGGYVVKYNLNMAGENDQLGPGVSGTQIWTYELTDPGAVSAPDLPAGCIEDQGEDVAPLPPDAKDIRRMPNFFQFSIALSADEVSLFYRDQAAAQGWEEIPVETEAGADPILNFKTGDGGLISIRLHKQENGTRVTLQILQGKQ